MKPLRHLRKGPPKRGFAILEALVGVLVISFAILGLVGLQASMTRAQTASQFRAQAATLAADLIGAMWADRPNLANYDDTKCDSYSRCKEWVDKVGAMLPGGTPTISVNSGAVTITIAWTAPGESRSNYVTMTSVQ